MLNQPTLSVQHGIVSKNKKRKKKLRLCCAFNEVHKHPNVHVKYATIFENQLKISSTKQFIQT